MDTACYLQVNIRVFTEIVEMSDFSKIADSQTEESTLIILF